MSSSRPRPRAAGDRKRAAEAAPDGPLYSLASLIVFVHLFCVLIALGANLTASPLQLRVLQIFRPYLQLLNFDPEFTLFHFTHAGPNDVDHRWEVLAAADPAADDSAWQALPDAGRFHGSDDYRRRQRLARFQSEQSDVDAVGGEAAAAELARSVAEYFVHRRGLTVQEIRCRRHLLQTWAAFSEQATAADRDPNHPSYFDTSYAARVVSDALGNVRVVRRSQARDAAIPRQPAADNNP
jgi:hypothetical protein